MKRPEAALKRPENWIEVDRSGDRYTRYDPTEAYGIGFTCLRQPYMSEAEWRKKLRDFLEEQPKDLEVYDDRYRTGLLLGTVADQLKLEAHLWP